MAWADTAYVTATNYRDRNGRTSSDFDVQLGALAIAVSRIYDRRNGIAPAQYAPQSAMTIDVRSHGGSLLQLRNDRGEQYFLRTATAVGIDSENDRTFDGYSLVLGTQAWLQGYPLNATNEGEPFTALELYPGVASASPTVWPDGVLVRITGDLGYAAVPGAVVQRCSNIMRELVEVGFGGPQVDMQAVEAAITGNRYTVSLLEDGYRRRMPI